MATRRRFSSFPFILPAAIAAMPLIALGFSEVRAAEPPTTSVPQKAVHPSSRKQSATPLLAPRRPDAPPKPNVTANSVSLRPNALLPSEYLPVSALRAGMTGYGLTVFRGNKIDRFDVTILGVLRKVYNGRDLVLVKLGGPNMSRLSGIAHGMSGSPVYVNGKLIGAVSMGSQFTREPIGYVTPIESMLDAWDPAIPQYSDIAAPGTSKIAALPEPVTIEGRRYTHLAFLPPGADESPAGLPPGTLTARPAATRILVSGISGPRFKAVSEALAKWGLEAQAGPGSGSGVNGGLKGSPLTPGGAIGMSLATGDIDLTATGTITYRRGNRLLAFGHPFLGIGPLAAPMFTAYVHDLEPSYADSSIIASPVDLIGSFSQDRPFSVAGTVGAQPNMIPITVHVNDKTMGSNRVFHAHLIQHPQLTPTLTNMAADAAISEVHAQPGDAMATVTTTVTADDVGTVTRTNRVYDSQEIDAAALADLQSLTNLLSANAFYPVAIRSVRMDVTIEAGRKTAQVERIFLNQTRYEPGDTVEVGVVLKPYRQERVVRTLKLRIPPNTPPGILPLNVQGGQSMGAVLRLGGFTFSPGGGNDYSNAATVKQLGQKWQEKERNDALVARLSLLTSAVSVGGEKLPDLPPNIDAALRGGSDGYSRSSGVRIERDEVKVSEETPYVLTGAQTLSIRVARHGQDRPSSSGGFSSGAGSNPGENGGGFSSPPPSGVNAGPAGSGGRLEPPGLPNADDLSTAPRMAPPAGNDDGDDEDGATTIHITPPGQTITPSSAKPRPATPGPVTSISLPPVTNSPAAVARVVGRAPGSWRHASAADFRAGKLDGVTVTSLGDVRLAPRLAKIAESYEPYFWSLAFDGAGGVFAGSGDNGLIYHSDASGTLTRWAQTGELEVHSLVRTPEGTLYAGTSPHGRIYRITQEGTTGGKATLLCELKEKYVLGLALSPDNSTLYAATGGGESGKIYAISLMGGGDPKELYSGGETNITALTVAPDGAVYAGTSPNGLVLKISGSGLSHPTVLYDAAETAIGGLAVAKDGTVYAGTAPRGVLYRIAPGLSPKILYDRSASDIGVSGSGGLTNLQMGPNDSTVYAAAGSTLIAIDTNGEPARTFEAASDIQILSILRSGDGNIWAATGNSAGLYRLEGEGAATQTAEGHLVSPVLDARATARWGQVRWTGSGSLYLETRSGDTADPDSGWSDWSRPYVSASGSAIQSPPGRFLQYRATLKGDGASASPTALRAVEVFYRTPNQAPQVSLLIPRGGEVMRGTSGIVRWTGMDPDRDTLLYAVSVSPDGGKTWTPLRSASGARSSFTAPAAASPTLERSLAELRTELERHPEISHEMRARILADAPQTAIAVRSGTASAPAVSASPSAATASTRETSLPFDTTTLPDGTYLVRVSASDQPSNPQDALTAEKISGEFRIVNRPPTLVLFQKAITILPDRSAKIEGIALHPDTGVAIRGVQYRIDGSADWMAGTAQDGLFDSDGEPFTLTTAPLPVGSHTVEVQALDEAGNAVTQKATVVVR